MERGSGFCTVIITDLGRRKGIERDHNGWGLNRGKMDLPTQRREEHSGTSG